MKSIGDEYEEFVTRMMQKNGVPMPIEYIALGLSGEYGELEDAIEDNGNGDATNEDVLKEIGDVLWYLSAMFITIKNERRDYSSGKPASAAGSVSQICDHVKKYKWHGKDLDYGLVQSRLDILLLVLCTATRSFGWTIDEVMQSNMDKLKSRYPQGFIEGGGIRD